MKNTTGIAQEGPRPEVPVFVIGHINPDTDSICSAIAYAYLKEKVTGKRYEPKRAGQLNLETKYVLERFGFPQPYYLSNVRRQVKDMDIRKFKRVLSCLSLKKAWEWMADMDVVTLPIVSEDGVLTGIITEGDIAESYMGMYDPAVLSKAQTTFQNITETLAGELVVGEASRELHQGKVLVAAANPDTLEEFIEEGDVIITGNRYETQLCAIEMNAGCVIITGGVPVSKTITIQAREHGCAIITTPYDTFTAARLINQSISIDFFMKKDNLVTFGLNDSIDEVRETMTKYRHRDFPVVDKDGKLLGMISRRKLLGARKKQVVLVDHNEKTQAVDGIADAEILEIIDHHRIGTLETTNPVYFRNQPVGCTATIVYQMYLENGVEIPAGIAGLLCSAIISDTLLYRSPTCTPMDRAACEALAGLAGIETEAHARAMFTAGSNFASRSENEIFYQDYKKFNMGDKSMGIAQVSSMSHEELLLLRDRLFPYMQKVLAESGLDMVLLMLTDILEEGTLLLFCGEDAREIVAAAFGREPEESSVYLPGVVSRKKQMVPAVMATMQSEDLLAARN